MNPSPLHPLDFVVIGLYLLGMLWIGRIYCKNEKTTDDYFLGGRNIPWWAAALSIYATGVSAISVVAIPAKTYKENWMNLWFAILPVIGILLVAFAFVPLLRKLNLASLMSYYEKRFNRGVRVYGTVMSILAQVAGRMSVVMLIPATALSQVTTLDLTTCILLMGLIATVYTVMGGIGAVIWSDVVQVGVIFGGTILCIFLLLHNIEGGWDEAMRVANANKKFKFSDFRLTLTSPTIWVFLIWGIKDVFSRVGQESMQRTFATSDEKEARKAFVGYGLISLPGQLCFFLVGTLLFVFYSQQPDLIPANLDDNAIFPLFISQKVPTGLAGLLIAGIFAASMSTLDSAMNSVATIVVEDSVDFTGKPERQDDRLKLARRLTVATGVAGTVGALILSTMETGSLWDLFETVISYLTGGLVAVTSLGLLTRRASSYGVIVGIAVATGLPAVLKAWDLDLHPFTFGGFTMIACSVTGYIASIYLPEKEKRDLTGLTVWDQKKKTV
jgi:SSS family transporter